MSIPQNEIFSPFFYSQAHKEETLHELVRPTFFTEESEKLPVQPDFILRGPIDALDPEHFEEEGEILAEPYFWFRITGFILI